MSPSPTLFSPALRRLAGLSASALVSTALLGAALPAAAECPKYCIGTLGVKNAAGIDPMLFQRLVFERGDTSVAAQAAVQDIAAAWKAAGGKKVLTVRVLADAGQKRAVAAKQAKARAASLAKALAEAGIPAAKLRISGG